VHPAIEHTITLEGRPIRYDLAGEGPPVVFVHGVWATGGVWDPVVDRLASRFRCIVPTLPLGVHRVASPPGVDRSPAALARVIVGLLEALDLRDVTLVGNDTGGALCQLVIATHPERIGRLVLTNCDAFEVFPPRRLEPLYRAAKMPALWWALAQLGRFPVLQRAFFATVSRTNPDMKLLGTLMNRFAADAGVREDLRQTICAISPRITLDAAERFSQFTRDVLVLWGTDDRFFPVSLGRRLAAAFPNARFQPLEGARLFVSNDAPDAVADAIASMIERTQRRDLTSAG
jgi:pimeloyl-ACP methyl ester carboxylesterase